MLNIKGTRLIGILLTTIAGIYYSVGCFLNTLTSVLNTPNSYISPFEVSFLLWLLPVANGIQQLACNYKSITRTKVKDSVVGLTLASVTDCIAVFGFRIAVNFILLEDAMSIMFLAPFYQIFLQKIFLKDPIALFDVGCGIMAFTGVLMITQPSFLFGYVHRVTLNKYSSGYHDYTIGCLCAFVAGLSIALEYTTIRKYSSKVSPGLFYTVPGVVDMVIVIIVMLATKTQIVIPTNLYRLSFLLFCIIFSNIGRYLKLVAIKYESPYVIQVIRLLDIPYAIILQYIFLSSSLTVLKVVGGIVMIIPIGGIYVRKWIIHKKETLNVTHKPDKRKE